MKKILVAVDFSDASITAVRQALVLAEALDSVVTLLHVLHVPAEAPGFYSSRKLGKKLFRNMDTALSAFDTGDAELARTVVRAKPALERRLRETRALHYDPLQDEGSDAARFSSLQLDMFDDMRCVFIYSESIALTMLHGYLDERGDVRSAA